MVQPTKKELKKNYYETMQKYKKQDKFYLKRYLVFNRIKYKILSLLRFRSLANSYGK